VNVSNVGLTVTAPISPLATITVTLPPGWAPRCTENEFMPPSVSPTVLTTVTIDCISLSVTFTVAVAFGIPVALAVIVTTSFAASASSTPLIVTDWYVL
jgi:hypothetical protein